MTLLGQKGGNHSLDEDGSSHEGTHHTKSMEAEPKFLMFVPIYAQVLLHLTTEHTCWRGERNSSEHLAGPGAPEAMEGKGHRRPSSASSQPQPNCSPPGQGTEGPCMEQM